MKYLASLVFALCLSASVAAQQPCFPVQELADTLKDKFQETPAYRAPDATGTMVVIFTSEDGKTWTLVRLLPDGTACLVIGGEDWKEIKQPGRGT